MSVPLRTWSLCAALVGLIVITRSPLLMQQRAIEDEAIYSVVAHEIGAGGQPYLDAVERKPPLLFWTYASIFRLFGSYNWRALHAVALLWVLATMAALFVLGLRLFDPDVAIVAALLYGVYQPWAFWNNLSFNGEVLMNLPIAWAYAIGLARSRSRLRPELAAAGALLAAAFLLKQPAAIAAVPLGLYLLSPSYRRMRGLRAADAAMQAALLVAGFASALAITAIWLRSRGLLREAVYWTIGDHDVPHVFWSQALEHTGLFVVACLPLVAGAVMSWRQEDLWAGKHAERASFAGLAVVSAIGAAESGRFYPHYYIAIVPALALLAAPALVALWRARAPRARVAARLSQVAIAAAVVVFFAVDCRALARLPADEDAGQYVRAHAAPTDRIFVWGRDPRIYLDARRRPASRFVDTFPLTGLIFGPPLPDVDTRSRILRGAWDTLRRDFAAHPPAYVIDVEIGTEARNPLMKFPQLEQLLATSYEVVARDPDCVIYRLRQRNVHTSTLGDPLPYQADRLEE
jgi:4-amino-4-deoxy-L-arabinose transferase-like glycosyltransferase